MPASRAPLPASLPQLCEAAQRIPGNHNFEKRIEFCDLVRYYYGQRAYVASQLAYNLSLQASNIAAMIVSAQVLDDFIIHVFGTSYAFDYARFQGIRAVVPHGNSPTGNVWFDPSSHEPTASVISLGYGLSMALCIPFGVMKLDENMWFQWVSFCGLLLFTAEFFVQFIMSCVPGAPGYAEGNGPARTPMFASNQSQVLGLAMFAYAYVVTIPSWLNEKKHGVNVNSAVWWPALVGFLMKLFVGLLGSWAFAHPTSNILTNLASGSMPEVTRYSSYLWNLLTLVPGIPILAIMVKYNLITGKIANPFMANILGVVLPWVVTAFCYEQQVLNTLCNWVAILVQGYVNFLVPILLYRRALIEFPQPDDGVEWARVRPLADEDGRLSVKAISMRVKSHTHETTSRDASPFFSSDARAPSIVRNASGVDGEETVHRDASPDDGAMAAGPATPMASLLGGGGGGPGMSPARQSHAGRLQASGSGSEADMEERSSKRLGFGPARFTDAVDEDDVEAGQLREDAGDAGEDKPDEDPVRAVPAWMRAYVTPMSFATGSAGFFFVLCTGFVVFNIVQSAVDIGDSS